ncbi:hypothetical protein JDV02_002268 [Purpureocillium takamizusanense]|uniref:Uncharacterized protein n=1 Tax=Purpureocillium takamizusanense TaxID=2060973 RepID=A0A9Q8QB85_9HYPO|nr:uncharacterized protein JDV02_002268 [Purpureocillium takamizusanense]UNI15766.1 hypothetical protein JDV02_002268 [Purpureocillium takamizusanense]
MMACVPCRVMPCGAADGQRHQQHAACTSRTMFGPRLGDAQQSRNWPHGAWHDPLCPRDIELAQLVELAQLAVGARQPERHDSPATMCCAWLTRARIGHMGGHLNASSVVQPSPPLPLSTAQGHINARTGDPELSRRALL